MTRSFVSKTKSVDVLVYSSIWDREESLRVHFMTEYAMYGLEWSPFDGTGINPAKVNGRVITIPIQYLTLFVLKLSHIPDAFLPTVNSSSFQQRLRSVYRWKKRWIMKTFGAKTK